MTKNIAKSGANHRLMEPASFFLMAYSGQQLSTREKGTLLGGVAGAGLSAIIGSAVGAFNSFLS
jgi:hypothetical protein